VAVKIPTPNLDKMMANKDWSQQLGGFLDWLLNTKSLQICKYDRDIKLGPLSVHPDTGVPLFVPVHRSINQWLADYIGIDLDAAEDERMAVLRMVRTQNTIRELEEPIE
jgi:hypothetical protein